MQIISLTRDNCEGGQYNRYIESTIIITFKIQEVSIPGEIMNMVLLSISVLIVIILLQYLSSEATNYDLKIRCCANCFVFADASWVSSSFHERIA